MLTTTLFNLFAIIIPIFSVAVIISKNPMFSVLYLIIVFFFWVAAFLVLIGLPYIGLVYLIIYIGAIAILFLFVIMMLNLRLEELTQKGVNYTKSLPLAAFVVFLFFFLFYTVLSESISDHFTMFSSNILNVKIFYFNLIDMFSINSNAINLDHDTVFTVFNNLSPETNLNTLTHIQSIGLIMYNKASLLLLVTGLIFLLVMVGAIILCLNPRSLNNEQYLFNLRSKNTQTTF